MCVLVINIFNEKIFILLWLWFSFLFIVTVLDSLYWFSISIRQTDRMRFVLRHLELTEEPEAFKKKRIRSAVQLFLTSYIKVDGVLILRMLAVHAGVMFCTELTEALWHRFLAKADAENPGNDDARSSASSDDNDDGNEDSDEEGDNSPQTFAQQIRHSISGPTIRKLAQRRQSRLGTAEASILAAPHIDAAARTAAIHRQLLAAASSTTQPSPPIIQTPPMSSSGATIPTPPKSGQFVTVAVSGESSSSVREPSLGISLPSGILKFRDTPAAGGSPHSSQQQQQQKPYLRSSSSRSQEQRLLQPLQLPSRTAIDSPTSTTTTTAMMYSTTATNPTATTVATKSGTPGNQEDEGSAGGAFSRTSTSSYTSL